MLNDTANICILFVKCKMAKKKYICNDIIMTSMKNTVLLLLAIFSMTMGFSQSKKYPTETDTHIFWQPERKLTIQDFQCNAENNPTAVKECDSLGYCVVGAFGLFHVIDASKKYKPGRYREILYMAPAFQKTESWNLGTESDTLGVQLQQLLYDLYELCARYIRYDIDHVADSIFGKVDNPYTTWFNTVYEDREENFAYMQYICTCDLVKKNSGRGYEEWRSFVDEQLEKMKDYATTPKDCYRFIANKPIEKKMVMAKYVTPNLYNRGKKK